MLPLSIFIIIWLILFGIFGLLTFFSIIQMIRFGVAGPMTYIATALFLAVAAIVVFSTILYLASVDWNLNLDLGNLLHVTPTF